MPRYVALLRGVNVGGKGRMAMADLRACVERIGHEDVATHIQTGNVLFRTPVRSAEKVATAMEDAVEADLGFRTAVMVRTAAQLTAALDENPFPDVDPAALHIAFLRERPSAARAGALVAPDGPDEVAVIGREVHLHHPGGMGRSKLSGAWLEKRLAVPLTVRNRKVVTALRDLLLAD
jgi:uncharacterized protein (DUF1697 family)